MIDKSKLFRIAHSILKRTQAASFSEALRMAWKAAKIYARMLVGVAHFTFRKANGTIVMLPALSATSITTRRATVATRNARQTASAFGTWKSRHFVHSTLQLSSNWKEDDTDRRTGSGNHR